METAVEAMESNEMARQGARTEISVPRNWSSTAALLRNFTGRNTNLFRVFGSETFYRRRGDVRGHQGGPHHSLAWPGGVGTPDYPSGIPDMHTIHDPMISVS
jgi:hypothetical protein